ncbi:MAG: sulfatase-like hydrolase/transferase [Anaerolineaceae bacterium]|nr:sulfatase-like hydrolase/transferase [Anaerolineaceae bacterium]
MTRPNFLLLIADDHRHSAIGGLGLEPVETPTLDRLMAQGTAFTRAGIMGATSHAVCLPSRGMLLSGRGLFRTPDPLPGDAPLLPELLWQEGYETCGIGKWHNHSESYTRCFSTGGKVFLGGMSDQYAVPVYPWAAVRTQDESRLEVHDAFSTTLFADEAIDFLQSRSPDDDEPFFAWVSFTSPHDPRTPPGDYATRYQADDIELPDNFMAQHPFDLGISDIRDEVLAEQPRDEAEIRRHIADYYGMITHMDAEIGRILETLEQQGLADNTVVIYCADHGLALGQHGLMGKQNVYEHSLRIPLILRGPGIVAGQRSDALCYLHDLYPTLLERAGCALPETSEGFSLNALLAGQGTRHRRSLFAAWQPDQGRPGAQPHMRSLRGERFKLIESRVSGAARSQLFDLRADPLEMNDLSESRGYQHVMERMRARLRIWQRAAGDPLVGED